MTMPPIDRDRPSIPAAYALHILRLLEERGYNPNEVRQRLDFRIPEGRIRSLVKKLSIAQQEQLARTLIEMAGERGTDAGGFGYEMGLSVAPAAHGVLGFALLSQLTVGRTINFFLRFSSLILPGVNFRLSNVDGVAALEIAENFQLSPDLTHVFYEMTLSGLWRSMTAIIPEPQLREEAELYFSHSEPPYHSLYKDRLPVCRFNAESYQIRCPAKYLNHPLTTGDAQAAKELEKECETELELVGNASDIVAQVQALLNSQHGGYPDIEDVCQKLYLSRSTLRRRLLHSNKNFKKMRDDAMANEAKMLLKDPWISIEKIASRIGYADPANFTRAFRRWTDMSPSEWRHKQ